jgi:hypothetical protein
MLGSAMGIGGDLGAVVTVLVDPVDIVESATPPVAACAMLAPTIPRLTIAPPATTANVLVLLDFLMRNSSSSIGPTGPSVYFDEEEQRFIPKFSASSGI